ncbi:MAG TPA: hypothetical protein VH596_14715 [Terriglobales bacterium]|jgi:hypothetical protein
MEIRFDELAADLLNSGYRKVAFLEVECKIDGTYRVAISPEQPVGEHFECPVCRELRPCSGIIAVGFSRKPIPFQERWCGPGNWNFQISDRRTVAAKPIAA